MINCELCGKDASENGKTISLYRGQLIKRDVSTAEFHSTRAVSTYEGFDPVSVRVCNRHIVNLWTQRLIAGAIAFLLLYFPILILVGWILSNIPGAITLQFIVTFIIAFILVALIVRGIRYDAFIASMLTLKESSHQAGYEYFAEKKYQRLMKLHERQQQAARKE